MSRLRREDGFTVMEMLIAVTVGFVVLSAALGLLESTVRMNTGVMAKTDAMQRGRIAMDSVTQQMKAQVCLDYNHPAILAGSDADTVTFYSDFSKEGKTPFKRKLTFDTTKNELNVFTYQTPSTAVPPPADTYPATPTSAMTLLQGVYRQRDDVANKDVPFLRYYAYKIVNGRTVPEEELTPPLNDAQAARVARIDINYFVLPTGSKDQSQGVNLSDQVMARHADPNLSVPDPNCV
jgi:hypothetical protein